MAACRLDAQGEVIEAELDNLLRLLKEKTANEFRQLQEAKHKQFLNEQAGQSALLLNYLVMGSLLGSRQRMGDADPHFWPEVRALDSLIAEKEAIFVSNIHKPAIQKLHGLLFDIQVPATGERATMSAPNFLLRCALDAVCRLASRRRVKKAELLTADVITMIDREIAKS